MSPELATSGVRIAVGTVARTLLRLVPQATARELRGIGAWVGKRLLPGVPLLVVLILLLRWGLAHAQALLSLRGLVRGTTIVWQQVGRAMAIGDDVGLPSYGKVLVRIVTTAVSCGTERAFFNSFPNATTTYPSFPGYSAAGEIVEVGKGVVGLRAGDRVALSASHCSVALANTSEVYPIPSTVPFEGAAFVEIGIIALQAVEKAHLSAGERVVVIGQGIIGQLLVQMTAGFGGHAVTSVCRTTKRLTEPLVRTAEQVIILERDTSCLWEGLEATVSFDTTGSPEGPRIALKCTEKGGRVVLVSSARSTTEKMDFGSLADREVTIIGAHISSVEESARPKYAQVFFQLLEQKQLDISSLITERVHPFEAEWFYRRLSQEDDNHVGALFCWEQVPQKERLRQISFLSAPDLDAFRHWSMIVKSISETIEKSGSGPE